MLMSKVTKLAGEILSGRVGILEGSRIMVRLYHELGTEDDCFNVFRALDSETYDCLLEPIGFPISEERRKNNARKIKEYEEFYRDEIFNRCRQLANQ